MATTDVTALAIFLPSAVAAMTGPRSQSPSFALCPVFKTQRAGFEFAVNGPVGT
jgi:hypothetical protein